ncbi:MAG: hypothetical protein RIC30_01400 [Marinoscillum sp.]|uniref:hypothetical protein n=1 Tax=Marinoscillum sp. TaxID=2024838 RepID=UPI003301EEB1
MKFRLSIGLSLLWCAVLAQSPLHSNLQNSTLGYTVITPPGTAKGLIVFIPGFAQTADQLLQETEFEKLAYLYGIATIVVPCGRKMYADGQVAKLLNEAIIATLNDYKIAPNQVVMGGFSAGGTIALKYTQYCLKYPESYPIKPKAVFAVDSPVDLEEIYHYMERELVRQYSEAGVSEAYVVKSIMERELGGTPNEVPGRYQELSPFTKGAKQGGEAEVLKSFPVRLYHDADIQWQLKNRRRSFYDMNIAPASEMINQLMLMGNTQAELMMTVGKGVRSNGERHPHSMSIVDEQDLMTWILKHLGVDTNPAHNKAGH